MNFQRLFSQFSSKKPARRQNRRNSKRNTAIVERVAKHALKEYEKTFIDLAKYDRGERTFAPLS